MTTARTMSAVVPAGPVIETLRLTLRPPTLGDAPAIARHLGNFAVAGNLSRVPHPFALADAEAYLRARPARPGPGETAFAIELEDELVGIVGTHEDGTGPVVGYWLAEPHWGRGIMTEAVTAVLDWYFGATDADLIVSGVFHFNMASLAIQHKLGFVETGRSTRYCLARGADVEHIDTELTREAFEAIRR